MSYSLDKAEIAHHRTHIVYRTSGLMICGVYSDFFCKEFTVIGSYIYNNLFFINSQQHMNQTQLENRLIDFADSIIKLIEKIPKTRGGNYIAGQLVRSGLSPALNYGEVRGAESRKDFLHKNQVVLKELRETYNALRILKKSAYFQQHQILESIILEGNELVSIFVKTIQTIKSKNK